MSKKYIVYVELPEICLIFYRGTDAFLVGIYIGVVLAGHKVNWTEVPV